MADKEPKTRPIVEIITPQTTVAEFDSLVQGILTPEDQKLFGDKAAELVINSLLYMTSMTPYPATFDSEAFGFIVDSTLSDPNEYCDPERIDRLLEIAREQGIVDAQENGRLFITQEVWDKISPILDRYSEAEKSKNQGNK